MYDLNTATKYSKTASSFIIKHDAIWIQLSFDSATRCPKQIKTRSLKHVNRDGLAHIVNSIVSNISEDNFPLSYGFMALSGAIVSAFNVVASIRHVTLTAKCKPWVTGDIKAWMRGKERSFI